MPTDSMDVDNLDINGTTAPSASKPHSDSDIQNSVDSDKNLSTSSPLVSEEAIMDVVKESDQEKSPLNSPTSGLDEVYPIAVLIDELKHEDLSLRLNAIKSINTIALALGDKRTRDELIPFLDESVDDDDEVLLALAEELGNLVPCVGGDEYAYSILRPLENLSCSEESLIRDEAVKSINKISLSMDQEQIETYLVPCIARLSQGVWFTSRSSATKLYASAYPKATDETKLKLLVGFESLCKDDTPMTRRSAAVSLKDMIDVMSPEEVIEHGVKNFEFLSSDDQDSVRLLTIEPMISIAKVLSAEQNVEYLNVPMSKLFSDKSWRVRYMVAENIINLSNNAKSETMKNAIGEVSLKLLQDQEAEVRGAICTQLSGLADIISLDVMVDKLLPILQQLLDDPMQHVRANLAKNITGLCDKFGPEGTVKYLLPLFLRILKDTFPDVRLNIISQLEQINKAEDKQWRVRLAIIEYVPLLASQLGVQFFDDKLSNLSMAWLGDPVFSIRNAATVNLKSLIEVFGVEWACKSIIPKIMAMANHPNYLYRITTIFAITTLAPTVSPIVIRDLILPTVETLMNDPIPNIRFNVAKSIEALTPVLSSNSETSELVQTKVIPILKKLHGDSDMDVRYFANKASISIGVAIED
ncbi:Protein phosphatase PP2A regulatory subunit A [Smittium culicis]|uniref:Protein phosphatase PP2A regulatory subunit A n=1 Tax=Smittium culicis TaxID=133412 RepID=A0A1R1YFR5_9FUNG|nr:Protein phosphatase PP2A regulatory subunit A [Smittium culicis]